MPRREPNTVAVAVSGSSAASAQSAIEHILTASPSLKSASTHTWGEGAVRALVLLMLI